MKPSMEEARTVFDKRGTPIERGDIVKVYHYSVGSKRAYMYKQCLGLGTYRSGKHQYVMFSHLNFIDTPGDINGPYHEWPGEVLPHYEIVQSVACDHQDRPRRALTKAAS